MRKGRVVLSFFVGKGRSEWRTKGGILGSPPPKAPLPLSLSRCCQVVSVPGTPLPPSSGEAKALSHPFSYSSFTSASDVPQHVPCTCATLKWRLRPAPPQRSPPPVVRTYICGELANRASASQRPSPPLRQKRHPFDTLPPPPPPLRHLLPLPQDANFSCCVRVEGCLTVQKLEVQQWGGDPRGESIRIQRFCLSSGRVWREGETLLALRHFLPPPPSAIFQVSPSLQCTFLYCMPNLLSPLLSSPHFTSPPPLL